MLVKERMWIWGTDMVSRQIQIHSQRLSIFCGTMVLYSAGVERCVRKPVSARFCGLRYVVVPLRERRNG